MIRPFPTLDREVGGINPARCTHEWAPWSMDYESYVREGYPTHMCQACFTPGRDTDVDIAKRKTELLAR